MKNKGYRWGWRVKWLGWKRALWFAGALDFECGVAYVVVFGLNLSYGWQLQETIWEVTTDTRSWESEIKAHTTK
jgi:hypothetical protein